MQNFTAFDMVIISITVLLGLRGLLRGFIKEVFGLIGIIGGIFIASRMADEIGTIIAPILALENNATIKLIGFIIGLIGFWIIFYLFGVLLSKIFSASGLGLFDRIFGFIFGSAKIFLIFSVITYGLYQIKTFKDLMNETITSSITFPLLVDAGKYIVKLDPSELIEKVEEIIPLEENKEKDSTSTEKNSLTEEIKQTVEEVKKAASQSTQDVIQTVKETVDENIKKEVNENVEKIVEDINKGN